MSFMFKPLAYDDPNAVNKIRLEEKTIKSLISGNDNVVEDLVVNCPPHTVLAIDGYVSAQFDDISSRIKNYCIGHGIKFNLIDMRQLYKTQKEIDEITKDNLPLNYDDDPVLLFGSLYEGKVDDFIDEEKINNCFNNYDKNEYDLTVLYGTGSSSEIIREYIDRIAYVDITPKVAAIRAREKKFVNIGDETPRKFNLLMRRNYFVDFEVVLKLRKELLNNNLINTYILGSNENRLQSLPCPELENVLRTLVKYPYRAKPVYLEGIWGGEYIRKLRNLPMDMADNVAWIFEFIPMEVSIEVAMGDDKIDIPFYTFVQNNGEQIMGKKAYEEFDGYFPLRFNYDDTWHSNGNMSIQVHPDEDFIIENYNEFGRQDEAYYIIATGHGAKTFAGWKGDGREFLELARKSEKTHEDIDYLNYINYVESAPGRQVMIPAGTIHASGRNQLILELGSLTIGSYTYKVYDYNRRDKEGNVRPIHTKNAEKVLHFERNTEWVNNNIAIEPILLKETNDYKEYVVGKTDLMYYETRRIELNTHGIYESSNNNQFTVLTLVDGEEVKVYSKLNPEYCFTLKYLEIITVPSTINDYVIEAKSYQPAVVHKTILKDGYSRYKNKKYYDR